ncbi:MAG: hypothetical protein AB1690_12785 [Candidatus Zixiibacteriota bacterium]
MSYTNSELVKKHFVFPETLGLRQREMSVIMEGTDWRELPGGGIVPENLKVRALRDYQPVKEDFPLTETGQALVYADIVSGSLTVAGDSSLGSIYRENIDYYFDYIDSRLKRLPGGLISEGAVVAVWYFRYHLYLEGTDYAVDYQRGRIRRLAGGSIGSGQKVFVDYDIPLDFLSDSVYAQAAAEASSIIEREIDVSRSFGANEALQTAATFLAASLVCRIAAVNGNSARADWVKLAESYRNDYENLLKPFRSPATRLNPPTHT